MPTLWFDFLNTPHVQFLKPFIRHFGKDQGFDHLYSCREFSETVVLAEKLLGVKPFAIGGHGGKNKLQKSLKLAERFLKVNTQVPAFDAMLACGNTEAALTSRLRGMTSINFDDNDISPNWMYAPFSSYAFFPRVIPTDKLRKQGFSKEKLYQYDGFKEDVYIADFTPDEEFPGQLPFSEYWLVRPENVQANYVKNAGGSIVPRLLKLLEEAGENVVFLPRYDSDRKLAESRSNVFIPDGPLDGLNASYWSKGVMTGAGTLAREAACMGKPAVSFFAGETFLQVDKVLIQQERVFFSRNPQDIAAWLKDAPAGSADLERSKRVQQEVFEQVEKRLPKP